jgi:hypothetical protein
MSKRLSKMLSIAVLAAAVATAVSAGGETKQQYQNRFRLMLDFGVRTNEYVRQHLGDRSLATYAHSMAERNAAAAEQMTPPESYALLHPHFLLVLENIERSFYHASQGRLERYRHHQKVVRKELHVLEGLAERSHLQLYLWDRGF